MVRPVIGLGSRTLEAKQVMRLFVLTKLTEAFGRGIADSFVRQHLVAEARRSD